MKPKVSSSKSAFGVEHISKEYKRLSPGDAYEPKHKQTQFRTQRGKLQNVDRKMKRTVVAMNRKGYRTTASDQGDLNIGPNREGRFSWDRKTGAHKDAYVAFRDKGQKKGKQLQQRLPKRFEFDKPTGPNDPVSVVRFRGGPVIGAVNRAKLRREL